MTEQDKDVQIYRFRNCSSWNTRQIVFIHPCLSRRTWRRCSAFGHLQQLLLFLLSTVRLHKSLMLHINVPLYSTRKSIHLVFFQVDLALWDEEGQPDVTLLALQVPGDKVAFIIIDFILSMSTNPQEDLKLSLRVATGYRLKRCVPTVGRTSSIRWVKGLFCHFSVLAQMLPHDCLNVCLLMLVQCCLSPLFLILDPWVQILIPDLELLSADKKWCV